VTISAHANLCCLLSRLLAGVGDALIRLSQTDNSVTQKYCSIAIANLSAHARLKDGSVSTLVRLFKAQDLKEKQNEAKYVVHESKMGDLLSDRCV
jgi:hypothetical protein